MISLLTIQFFIWTYFKCNKLYAYKERIFFSIFYIKLKINYFNFTYIELENYL